MKPNLCLNTPKTATGLEVCKNLNDKDICCSVEEMNKYKGEFEAIVASLKKKFGEKDKKMADVEKSKKAAEEESEKAGKLADAAKDDVSRLIRRL
mgnify:CR=1 FL=1